MGTRRQMVHVTLLLLRVYLLCEILLKSRQSCGRGQHFWSVVNSVDLASPASPKVTGTLPISPPVTSSSHVAT